jgi:predicted nucleotidyltransferase
MYRPLIEPSNSHGLHLRACYTLSIGDMFGLPPIPTDDEYCRRFDKSLEPHQLPKFDLAALQAARFAELAMGALADMNPKKDDNVPSTIQHHSSLLLSLVNASVLCLQDCIEERVHPSLMFDVARTYFLHALLRMQLGDMERYFKYRRICLRHLAQMDEIPGAKTLMAAVSFQDSLAYMIHGASESDVPIIDLEFPRVPIPNDVDKSSNKTTDAEKKYGIRTSPSSVASNPLNQMWIQGAPPILIDESAPARSRVLDALACAIRSSLDFAKAKQTKEPTTQSSRGRIISRKRKFLFDAEEAKAKSATEWVVEQNPEDLSCTNLLATSSKLLMEEEESLSRSPVALRSIYRGHQLLVSALDIIVNVDGESECFWVQNIVNVLEEIVEHPVLLFQGGPTYHIINNCAILLARIVNKLHANNVIQNESARAQFNVAMNIYNGSRLVLEKHKSKLPCQLQCHEIPIPNIAASATNGEPLIDLSRVSICQSYNCQQCFAADVPPDVLATRVASTIVGHQLRRLSDQSLSSRSAFDLDREFDVNDRVLLGALSRIINK